jgi:hypothetical protein
VFLRWLWKPAAGREERAPAAERSLRDQAVLCWEEPAATPAPLRAMFPFLGGRWGAKETFRPLKQHKVGLLI